MMTDAEWVDVYLREHWVEELGTLMSLISERCYCAGWVTYNTSSLKIIAPKAVETGEAQHYGQDVVRVTEARLILELVELIGGWVVYTGEPYVKYRIARKDEDD